MMDLFHKLTKLIDHERGTIFGVIVLASAICLASCAQFDGKRASSRTGEIVNSDELRSEYVQESNILRERWSKAKGELAVAQSKLETIASESEALDAGYEADAAAISDELNARGELIGDLGTMVANASGVPWLLPLVTLGSSALAGGAIYDNRRKNGIIKETKTEG